MKKFLLFIVLFVGCLVSKAATFNYDLPADATNIVKYHLYGRTNGLANTNFAKLATVNHPSTNIVLNITAGVSQTFYAVSEDSYFIESEPSNFVDYYFPPSIPPTIYPILTINSYNVFNKTWGGVTLTWSAVSTNYAVTNYIVTFESVNTLNQSITNKYNTTIPGFTLASLALNDYKIYVTSHNLAGSSIVAANSIIYLSEKNPKKVSNLIIR